VPTNFKGTVPIDGGKLRKRAFAHQTISASG
jgi:hypothetical protein